MSMETIGAEPLLTLHSGVLLLPLVGISFIGNSLVHFIVQNIVSERVALNRVVLLS